MKDEKQLLESFEMPPITEADILTTIQHSKILLKQAPLQKRETHTIRQMQQICFYHFPKIFILQVALTILLFLAVCSTISKDQSQTIVSTVLVIGGILFSMITSTEILRNRFYDMWETEKACSIRMEKIIGFKLSLLTTSTFILFSVISILLSILNTNANGITIITLAILPYLCITTCIVQLKDTLTSIQSLLFVYTALTLFFLLPMIDTLYYTFIDQNNWILLMLCFFIYLFLTVIKLKKVES